METMRQRRAFGAQPPNQSLVERPMTVMFRLLTAALLSAPLLSAPAAAEETSAPKPDREALRAEIRALLQEEPELVAPGIRLFQEKLLEERRQAEEEARRQQNAADGLLLSQLLPELESGVAAGERVLVQGDENGDVTLIEFSDYNCAFCRRVQPTIQALLSTDKKIRHVVKLLPFIGSEYPEFAMVAAGLQGDQAKTTAFHQAMMAYQGQLDEAQVLEIAAEVGLDAARLAKDVDDPSVVERLSKNIEFARQVNIEGTPALVLPDRIARGAYPLETLTAMISEIRESR